MIKIGLTGGLGCDYSKAIECFKNYDIPVFDADVCAKGLFENKDVIHEIVSNFGVTFLGSDGKIIKEKFSEYIFNNNGGSKYLFSILSRYIKQHFDKWSTTLKKDVVIEKTSLLFESGAFKSLNYNILLDEPFKSRVENLNKRTGKSIDVILDISKNQWSRKERIKNSSYVIDMDKDINVQLSPICEKIIKEEKDNISMFDNTSKWNVYTTPNYGDRFTTFNNTQMFTQYTLNDAVNRVQILPTQII